MTRERTGDDAVEGNVLVSEWEPGESPQRGRRTRERLVSREDVTGWVAVRRTGRRPDVPVRGFAQLAREMGIRRLAVVAPDADEVEVASFPGVEIQRTNTVDDAVSWAGR